MKNQILLAVLFFFCINAFAQKKGDIPVGQIITPLGEIWISLDERTPNHQSSFIELAEAGYWDSLTFNRVIPNFVAQGGCPDTPEGFNDPEYLLAPEFHPDIKHVYGAVGAGRDGNPDKLSARCQFYIVQNKEGLARLDGDYTVFGEVIKGMDIVDQIVNVPRDSIDQPETDITLDINILYLSKRDFEKLKGK
ncbi:peptidylprolyl isomerase [Algoriphagus namhaensis]|uniref:Peptidyl-prolyl cis-trans isomerase n=1 Tax=Algoriphagus namhaensis TaxID=915353 RepID=A0ABV8AS68_9BACT